MKLKRFQPHYPQIRGEFDKLDKILGRPKASKNHPVVLAAQDNLDRY